MTAAALSEEARMLLETELESYDKLEIVHVLRRTGRPMLVLEIAQQCHLDARTIASVLAELHRSELVEIDVASRTIRLGRLATETACDTLLAQYADDGSAILAELSTIAMRRIRGMAARVFPEVPILPKKRNDDDG